MKRCSSPAGPPPGDEPSDTKPGPRQRVRRSRWPAPGRVGVLLAPPVAALAWLFAHSLAEGGTSNLAPLTAAHASTSCTRGKPRRHCARVRTYYVSPSGSDANSGTSPRSAWRTVRRVNRARLIPGDAVLFEGGARFSDATLMPSASGESGAAILFGSYGPGNAQLPRGVWFSRRNYLTFQHLTLDGDGTLEGQGIQGTGDEITVRSCSIANYSLPINATGPNSSWSILANTIDHSGNSGMLLEGEHFRVSGNTISETGLDPSITYGKHGIYLKVSDATVTDNTIADFSKDGISVRYRDSVLRGNHIENGPIGIAWFQYDPIAGTSYWTQNTITGTTVAGIYVSPSNEHGGNTRESFVIEHNTIDPAAGVSMDLKPTTGTYAVAHNNLAQLRAR
jgi:hypothetical protein